MLGQPAAPSGERPHGANGDGQADGSGGDGDVWGATPSKLSVFWRQVVRLGWARWPIYIHASIHSYMHTYIHAYMHACMHAYILRVPHIQVDPLGRDSVGYAHVRENLSLVFAPQVVDPLRLRLAVCVCVCACVRACGAYIV